MESKTIRVRRIDPREIHRFDNDGCTLSVSATAEYDECEELDITITPVASREERLREALRFYADPANWKVLPGHNWSKVESDRGFTAQQGLEPSEPQATVD